MLKLKKLLPLWQKVVVLILCFIAGGAGGAVMMWQLNQNSPINNNSTNSLPIVSREQVIKVTEESATAEVVKKVSPSVVSIIISKDLSKINNLNRLQLPFNDFFNNGFPFDFFFNGQPFDQSPTPKSAPQGKQEVGGGTGFVINKDKGLILTNRHVVEDTEADYAVLTNDGRKFEAKVVARDSVNDMALVQISNHTLPAVTLGDSDAIQIGDTVIAIGNALGEYRNTVTKGVISGKGRNVVAGDGRGSSESLEGVFQTDAAINPGNSGGPLVNLSGQVIGMNTAVSREGQLIGFAIPVNEAKRMIMSFEKNGRIVRPYLGIRYVAVTPELARVNNLSVDYGALILSSRQDGEVAVVPGSPADKAGLVENDIILEVQGKKIDAEHSLVKALARFNPGDTVKFKIYHKGDNKEISIKLEEFKD